MNDKNIRTVYTNMTNSSFYLWETIVVNIVYILNITDHMQLPTKFLRRPQGVARATLKHRGVQNLRASLMPRRWRVWRRLVHWSVALGWARFRCSGRDGKKKERDCGKPARAHTHGRVERKKLPRAMPSSPVRSSPTCAALFSLCATLCSSARCPLLSRACCRLHSITRHRPWSGSRHPCLPTGREGEGGLCSSTGREGGSCLPFAHGLLCSLFLGMLLLCSSQLCLALESWVSRRHICKLDWIFG
jgi:hypothetical protein